jgi:hypothetical protein
VDEVFLEWDPVVESEYSKWARRFIAASIPSAGLILLAQVVGGLLWARWP